MDLVRFLLVGCAAGWIVGRVVRGSGYGWIGNTLLGAVGSLIGGYLFGFMGISISSTSGALIMAVMGAIGLLLLASFLRPSRKKKSEDDD